MQSEISVSDYGLTKERLITVFTETVNYYPELFHISNSIRYTYSGNYVLYILPEYTISHSEYRSRLAEYNSKLDYIISGTIHFENDLEKILYVHDYLVTNFEYDTTYSIYDAYNFLTTGTGVCQAYTQTFNAIMHRLGIECTSAINEPENHTWNIVRLDGKYYHIDCTHDDPLGQSAGSVRYDLFLLSDQSIKNHQSHSSWYTVMFDAVCDSTGYESGYIWNTSKSGTVYSAGKWYYIKEADNQNSYLMSTDDLKNGTVIEKFNSTYYVYGTTGSYYPGYHGGITAAGTTVYYSSPSDIRYYDTLMGNNGILGLEETVSISSCRYDGHGKLNVFLSKKPSNYDESGNKEIKLFDEGDANGDGLVSSTDLVLVQKYLLTGSSKCNWAVFDVAGGIGVDMLDFIRIKNFRSNICNQTIKKNNFKKVPSFLKGRYFFNKTNLQKQILLTQRSPRKSLYIS